MSIKEALDVAAKYHLESEVLDCINQGYSPEEALKEWDLLEVSYLINEFDLVKI